MRFTLRTAALLLVLLVLLVPLGVQASGGPCPDDPELSKDCLAETPPFYVVINRTFEDLNRPGSGCQPIILKNPDCKDCCGEDEACLKASDDLETRVCPMLAERVDWAKVEEEGGEDVVVYEMCCECATDPAGSWTHRMRLLYEDGTCPIDEVNSECFEFIPPGTGIDLPAPVIIGGLAVIGAALLAAGVTVRRRTVKAA